LRPTELRLLLLITGCESRIAKQAGLLNFLELLFEAGQFLLSAPLVLNGDPEQSELPLRRLVRFTGAIPLESRLQLDPFNFLLSFLIDFLLQKLGINVLSTGFGVTAQFLQPCLLLHGLILSLELKVV